MRPRDMSLRSHFLYVRLRRKAPRSCAGMKDARPCLAELVIRVFPLSPRSKRISLLFFCTRTIEECLDEYRINRSHKSIARTYHVVFAMLYMSCFELASRVLQRPEREVWE